MRVSVSGDGWVAVVTPWLCVLRRQVVQDLRLKLELDQWAVSPVLKASQKRLKGRTPAP